MNEYYMILAWSDCPYCDKAKDLLIEADKQFMFCILDESRELLEMYKEANNWETVPMVFHHKKISKTEWSVEFIGGYSDLVKKFTTNGD